MKKYFILILSALLLPGCSFFLNGLYGPAENIGVNNAMQVATLKLEGYVSKVAYNGKYVYAAYDENKIAIINVDDKKNPKVVYRAMLSGNVQALVSTSDCTYAICDNNTFVILYGSYDTSIYFAVQNNDCCQEYSEAAIYGNRLYIFSADGKVDALDVTSKLNPVSLGKNQLMIIDEDAYTCWWDYSFYNNYIYILKDGWGTQIDIYDFADPADITNIKTIDIGSTIEDFVIYYNFIIVLDNNSLVSNSTFMIDTGANQVFETYEINSITNLILRSSFKNKYSALFYGSDLTIFNNILFSAGRLTSLYNLANPYSPKFLDNLTCYEVGAMDKDNYLYCPNDIAGVGIYDLNPIISGSRY